MFPMWFDLFSVYLHSSFTTSIILDSLLNDLNGTTILQNGSRIFCCSGVVSQSRIGYARLELLARKG